VPVLTEEILEKIRREIEAGSAVAPRRPAKAGEDDSLPPVVARSEFTFLRHHWLFNPDAEIRSHRPLIGLVLVAIKKAVRACLRAFVVGGYFDQERRLLTALAERSDRLLREVTERTKAVAERNDLFLAAIDSRLEALEAQEQLRGALRPEASTRDRAPSDDEALSAELAVDLYPDAGQELEEVIDRFRGCRCVLDLGCGRGEVLEGLARAGIPAEGVEASPALVGECHARGENVRLGGLLAELTNLPEGAIDGLIVTRTAERFSTALWPRLVASAWRAIRPEGIVVFAGVGDSLSAARLRSLVARQRFSAIEVRAAAGGTARGHLVIARRHPGS
jgi:SAM-dependent methyltransferase